MQSHAFKGLFFEKVTDSGLLRIKDSFEAFFGDFLSGAAQISKQCGETMFQSLLGEPYTLAFGIYILKTREDELNRQFCNTVTRQAI